MASGDKPAIKIAVKSADKNASGGSVSLGAAWIRDDGSLGGAWDKRIARVAILLDDGTKLDIKRGADGKMPWYFNVYDNREQGGGGRDAFAAQPSRGGGYGAKAAPAPADDFGSDDLPF